MRRTFLSLAIFMLTLSACSQARDPRYTQAAATAEAQIRTAFPQWHAVTPSRGESLEWRGDQSRLLWIEHQDAAETSGGAYAPEHWRAWAQTQAGRYFQLTCMVDKNYRVICLDTPREVTVDELISSLITAGQTERIKELGLPMKVA